MRKRWIVMAPLALLGILLFMTLGGIVVMQLWNWLLPTLFGGHTVTFWQALGLLVLCRILFGRWGGHRGYGRSRIRRRMEERWERMTPEEREQFQQGMRGRCGFGHSAGEAKAAE